MIHEFEQLDSTQTKAKELIELNQAIIGDIVWCHEQLAGRGRGNHQWHSQTGDSLTCTFIAPTMSSSQVPLPLVIGVLLAQQFNQLTNKNELINIKWPNDLYYKGKKLGGILIENNDDYSLIGIGINVNYTQSLEPLGATAINCLNSENQTRMSKTLISYDTRSILNQVIQALIPILSHFSNLESVWSDAYTYLTDNQLYLNQLVNLNSGNTTISGIIRGIDKQGYLLIEKQPPNARQGKEPKIQRIIQASNIRPI